MDSAASSLTKGSMPQRSKVCSTPGCSEIVLSSNGKCPKCRAKARRVADRRTGRIRGSRWSLIRRQVLREQPFCQDGRVCHGNATSVQVDHITPLAFGGHPTARANLQGICFECHDAKTREEQSDYHRRADG